MSSELTLSDRNYSVWGLPGTIIWGGLIIVAYIATQIAVMIAYIGINHDVGDPAEYLAFMEGLESNDMVLSLGLLLAVPVCGLLMLGAIKVKKNSNIKHYLALKLVDLATLKYWLLLIIGFIVASDTLTLLLSRSIVPESMLEVYRVAASPILLSLAIIIAAPIFEELFFRGFLISGLSTTFIGSVGAVIFSSAIWAAIHTQYDLYGIITIFVMGIILGIARLKTGSVILAIVLHAFANLVATIQTFIFLP